MTSAADNKQALMRCIELFNQGTLEWVDTCYSDKLEWIELPKSGTPSGRRGDIAAFRQAAAQTLTLFPNRRLRVLSSVAESDCVAMEQEWQGTAASTVGDFVAARTATLRVASFFTLENGLIIKQIDYCVSGG